MLIISSKTPRPFGAVFMWRRREDEPPLVTGCLAQFGSGWMHNTERNQHNCNVCFSTSPVLTFKMVFLTDIFLNSVLIVGVNIGFNKELLYFSFVSPGRRRGSTCQTGKKKTLHCLHEFKRNKNKHIGFCQFSYFLLKLFIWRLLKSP